MRGSRDDRSDVPRELGETVGTLSLLALLDEGVRAAVDAERLLTRCQDDAVPSAADARNALHLRITFAGLQRWVEDLELTDPEQEVRDETARLLAFYLHLLTHAFERDISAAGRERLAIRSRGPLTGAPCARLMTLRERVSSWAR